MRQMAYLSPTSARIFGEDHDQFYMQYLCDNPPPRFAQTQPMSIGSAFDAYVKSYLHERLFGKNSDPQFDLDTLFEAQVEVQWRDWAKEHGAYAFKVYLESGALADLALELGKAIGKPKFEIEIKGIVSNQDPIKNEVQDVVFLGKPDVFFINADGHFVILDWKVNGWCSKTGASPAKGYLQIREDDHTTKGHHKNAIPMFCDGMLINVAHKLEDIDLTWARQLGIYGWLSGADIGDEFITCIDQLACKPNPGNKFPRVKVAQVRVKLGRKFQLEYFAKCYYIWQVVHSDWIFRNMTKTESYEHCKALDSKAMLLKEMLENGVSDEDRAFLDMTSRGY